MEEGIYRSPGHCMVAGTASTMAFGGSTNSMIGGRTNEWV